MIKPPLQNAVTEIPSSIPGISEVCQLDDLFQEDELTHITLQDGFDEFMLSPERVRSKQIDFGTNWYLDEDGLRLLVSWIQDTEELVAAEVLSASIVEPGSHVNAQYTGRYVVLGQFTLDEVCELLEIVSLK